MFWLTVLFKVVICSIDEQHVSMRPQDSMTNLSKFVDTLETFQPSPLNVFQHTTQDALFYEEDYLSLEPNPNPPNYQCQDVPPSGFLSCQDYVKHGWCHLIPQYCAKSCWDCCIDFPAYSYIPCQYIKLEGYCEYVVKYGYCLQTCRGCEVIGDIFALQELKNSIKFPNQLSTWTGWNICSSWAGVNCTNNRVSTISLGYYVYNFQEHEWYQQQIIVSDAQTSIPKSFSLLSQLTGLWLHQSRFSQAIPVELSVLTNLEAFDAYSSAMSGVFPPQFSTWKKMKFMEMSYNKMVGRIPAQYSEWKDMEIWWTVNNYGFAGVLPPQFSVWKKMQYIDLRLNQMVGTIPAQYSEWKDMEVFRMDNNGFTGVLPPQFSTWKKMQCMDISQNQMVGRIPAQYSEWKDMLSFRIDNNGFTGRIPVQYSEWKYMEVFSIANNRFTGNLPEEYSSWNFLKYTWNLNTFLSYSNNLTGSIPVQYSTFKSLENGNFCYNTNLCAPSTLKNYPFAQNCPSC